MRIFAGIYKVFSVLFCIFLVMMLLIAVSALPPFGEAGNPVNNEVSERYIENGLQEKMGGTKILAAVCKITSFFGSWDLSFASPYS